MDGTAEQDFLRSLDALPPADDRRGEAAAPLVCPRPGHPAGHRCLALATGLDLRALSELLTGRYGGARNLAMGGFTDPTVTERTGLPLLTPFGDRVTEMRAWANGDQWIGCGTLRADGGPALVLLLAERPPPPPRAPSGVSWLDLLAAATEWTREAVHPVDWPATEALLGTPLPTEYKQFAERFGPGDFDGYLTVMVPGAGELALDLVDWHNSSLHFAERSGDELWAPHGLHPAPGGLLQWAHTEQRFAFYWLVDHPDPDRWPILTNSGDFGDAWERFDGSLAECVHDHLLSAPGYSGPHWFDSYDSYDRGSHGPGGPSRPMP
ncbi:SMI1/KNR4 family protein [Streptomyces amakusaensis]|uniref:Knr4/Smi1-like domain-containing protein n=1 Tax=Streptomyces amakusaensis TaxID=67271 RepID=A0ABW0APJ4_9ACTN